MKLKPLKGVCKASSLGLSPVDLGIPRKTAQMFKPKDRQLPVVSRNVFSP